MVRFLLWMLLFYFVWRIVKSLIAPPKKQTKKTTDPSPTLAPPFHDVQDAQFEDITPKSPSDVQSSSPK